MWNPKNMKLEVVTSSSAPTSKHSGKSIGKVFEKPGSESRWRPVFTLIKVASSWRTPVRPLHFIGNKGATLLEKIPGRKPPLH